MDFTFTDTQHDAAALASTIFKDQCTPERLKAIDAEEGRFDRDLWKQVADAGLVGLCLPEANGGSGLGLLELCSVLVEAGRFLAPIPLGTHVATALAIAEFGTDAQKEQWLDQAVGGQVVLTSAFSEDRDHNPAEPTTRAQHDGGSWVLTGTKTVVPAGPVADLFVVPAWTGKAAAAFLVHPDDPGVTVSVQGVSNGDRVARLELDNAVLGADRLLGTLAQGSATVQWLEHRMTLVISAVQLGTLRGALSLTAEYAKTREQFGRPIGTFQAVSQRLADGYIDVLGADLTLWQAAWRLEEGLPAEKEVAEAKLWAADAGHRIAHTTVHVHGGVGIDLDGEAHRFFANAKVHEFELGGGTDQARRIGRLLAAETA